MPFVEQLVRGAAHRDSYVLVGHGGLYHAMLPIMLKNVDHTFAERYPLSNTGYVLAEARRDGLHCCEWCGVVPAAQA